MANKGRYEAILELGAKIQSSVDQSFGAVQKRLDGLEKSAKTSNDLFGNMAKAVAGVAGAIAGLSVVKDFIGDSIEQAMTFESSMADVAKVVDGLKDPLGNTTQAYADMSKEIIDMSLRLPMTTSEIAELMSAAAQSGIAAEELTRFAEGTAKMGVAFDLPAESAGEMAAVIRSSLGISQDEFVALADKVNYFGNTTTQSSDKLIEVVKESGLIGKQAGVAGDEIAALSAAITGMDTANMGTALNNIFGSLMAGKGATDKALSAWEKLGFDASQVARDMLVDSEGTMLSIFQSLKEKIPADELSATVSAIFGDNKSTQMAIASFTENLDDLKNNFETIGDSTKYAGSMQDEFDSRAATTENKVKLMKNAFGNLQITIGNFA
ncbi:MAG: phage tail tape measure protein, partial [Clostridiales bacterium]|nr:phage tail tape measure protein [Clostridiales bacterium]